MGYYTESGWVNSSADEASGCGPAGQPASDCYLERIAGRREAAEHILAMWKEPWPVTEKRFIGRMNDYVESLK